MSYWSVGSRAAGWHGRSGPPAHTITISPGRAIVGRTIGYRPDFPLDRRAGRLYKGRAALPVAVRLCSWVSPLSAARDKKGNLPVLKPILVGTATFVILCVGFYVVLTNSHIDIFPGIETERDFETGKIVRKETTVSLLDAGRPKELDGQGAELTAGGTVVEVLVVLVLPLVLGAAAFWITRKMTARKPAGAPAPAKSE